MRKLENAFWLVLDLVELMLDNAFELALVVVAILLAMVGLVGVVKGGGWSVWLALLLFSACAVLFTYRLLARLGILKRRR